MTLGSDAVEHAQEESFPGCSFQDFHIFKVSAADPVSKQTLLYGRNCAVEIGGSKVPGEG